MPAAVTAPSGVWRAVAISPSPGAIEACRRGSCARSRGSSAAARATCRGWNSRAASPDGRRVDSGTRRTPGAPSSSSGPI
eukprot:5459287-Alexandrium_andersonii.AAC.1